MGARTVRKRVRKIVRARKADRSKTGLRKTGPEDRRDGRLHNRAARERMRGGQVGREGVGVRITSSGRRIDRD